jgi:hypothetical protein
LWLLAVLVAVGNLVAAVGLVDIELAHRNLLLLALHIPLQ